MKTIASVWGNVWNQRQIDRRVQQESCTLAVCFLLPQIIKLGGDDGGLTVSWNSMLAQCGCCSLYGDIGTLKHAQYTLPCHNCWVFCEADLTLVCSLQESRRLLTDLAAHRLQESRRLLTDLAAHRHDWLQESRRLLTDLAAHRLQESRRLLTDLATDRHDRLQESRRLLTDLAAHWLQENRRLLTDLTRLLLSG